MTKPLAMYREFAGRYDALYARKDYQTEAAFLEGVARK